MARRLPGLRLPNGHTRSANASPVVAFSQRGNPELLAAPVVVIVMVELTAALAGVTVDGENEHVSPEGRPEQPKLTIWLNPFWGVTDSVKVAD